MVDGLATQLQSVAAVEPGSRSWKVEGGSCGTRFIATGEKKSAQDCHCHSVASRLLFCGSGFRHPHHHTTSTSTEDCNSTPHRAHTTWVHFWYSFQQFSTVSNSFRIVWNSFGIVWNSWLDSGVSGLTV
ncbi:hypothetical protein M758_11G148900 [Ceratodon purpureus]|nr:hypothetical protein M758_11G148900 [Ceratodon purpureus]